MGAQGQAVGREIEVLQYPACAGGEPGTEWTGWADAEEDGAAAQGSAAAGGPALDKRLAEAKQHSFEAGRERGREEGRKAEHEAHAAALTAQTERTKQQMGAMAARFEHERDRYLHAVEHEVVKLALAVAARILRREAQMDPLLLTGAVRVALGQLAASTEVELRVPAGELELWKEAIAHVPNLALKPKVVAGEGMRLGDCAIASKVGSVDLGIRSQLGEIERGFFDRAGGHAEARTAQSAQAGEARP